MLTAYQKLVIFVLNEFVWVNSKVHKTVNTNSFTKLNARVHCVDVCMAGTNEEGQMNNIFERCSIFAHTEMVRSNNEISDLYSRGAFFQSHPISWISSVIPENVRMVP
jgi:hypothetical protein